MPRPGGIKRWCCLTPVCLTSVAYIRSAGGVCVCVTNYRGGCPPSTYSLFWRLPGGGRNSQQWEFVSPFCGDVIPLWRRLDNGHSNKRVERVSRADKADEQAGNGVATAVKTAVQQRGRVVCRAAQTPSRKSRHLGVPAQSRRTRQAYAHGAVLGWDGGQTAARRQKGKRDVAVVELAQKWATCAILLR